MHVVADVLAVQMHGLVARRAQGGMQDGALFGQVDLFAGKHGIALRRDMALFGQGQQQVERALFQAIFGIVQEQAGSIE